MTKPHLIFVNALVGIMLLCPTRFLHAETAVGRGPLEYVPLAGNGAALQRLNTQFQSGAISFREYEAGMARLEKNVTLTGTSDGDSPGGSAPDIIPAPGATDPGPSAGSAKPDAAVRRPAKSPSPCPAGWITTAENIPNGPAFNCEQDCYDAKDKSWDVTTYAVNQEGAGWVAGGSNKQPPYGEVLQDIFKDGGAFSQYDNFYLGSAADLQAMINYQKQFGNTDITFQGPAPDPKAGYQLQILYAPAHAGGDLCSAAAPYYCAPSYLTQSPSCH